MSHQKWLQRIRLITMLLVSGILGGLLTPLQSEAGTPTLTFKVDGGSETTIPLTAVTCNSTETLTFTQCYTIGTVTATGSGATVNRNYKVQSVAGSQARLRVGDKVGQDIFSIIGVQFLPTVADWSPTDSKKDANYGEQHILSITMGMAFDNSTVNVNNGNGALYAWGVRAGGEIRPGPTTAGACGTHTSTGLCDADGDVIDFPGKGTFSPTLQNKDILNTAVGATINTKPLHLSIAGPKGSNKPVSFDGKTESTLGQVSPDYPKFACDVDGANTGANSCRPTITQTMTVTLKGPDSLVLTGGADGIGSDCAVGISTHQQKQLDLLAKLVKFLEWLETQRPNDTRLKAIVNYLESFLNTATRTTDPQCPGASLNDLFFAIEIAQDTIHFFTDGAVPAEPALTGTITINKNTLWRYAQAEAPPYPNGTFDFAIYQLDCSECSPFTTAQIAITDGTGNGTVSVSLPPGQYRLSETDAVPGGLGGLWTLSEISCGTNPTFTTSAFTITAGETAACNVRNFNESD